MELVRGGIMPPAAAGNQPPAGAPRLPGHQAGTAPAKVTAELSPGHAPGSQGSLLCNGGHFQFLTRRNELHLFLGNPVPSVAFIL